MSLCGDNALELTFSTTPNERPLNYISSKANTDYTGAYQSQIIVISGAARLQPKPPSPITTLTSISLSDFCCWTSLAHVKASESE